LEATDGEEITNEIPGILGFARAHPQTDEMCLIHRDFKHLTGAKAINFELLSQGPVNHARQAVVNHADRSRCIETRLTSLFKPKRCGLWQAPTHRPGT
jgi:hypothetical protein